MPKNIYKAVEWEAPTKDGVFSKLIELSNVDLIAIEVAWEDAKGTVEVLLSVSKVNWVPSHLEPIKLSKSGVELIELKDVGARFLKLVHKGSGNVKAWVNAEGA
jgi:hypothetical protein